MVLGAQGGGLRERKKRAARESIATAAQRLFAERGYDAVTVAEIAAAAVVSEKTVFNHFATKEELVFADRAEGLARLVAAIRERPAGTSVLDVFRAATGATLDELGDDTLMLARVVESSEALQERLTAGWGDELAALATAIAETSGSAGDDLVPAVVARTLSWTHRAVLRAALAGLVAGDDRGELAARLRTLAARAYDQLADGLGEFGRTT